MHLSDRFLALAQQHLNALTSDGAAERLALYLTERQEGATPSLTLIALHALAAQNMLNSRFFDN